MSATPIPVQDRIASDVIVPATNDFDYSLAPSYIEVIPMPVLIGIGLFAFLFSLALLMLYYKWIFKP